MRSILRLLLSALLGVFFAWVTTSIFSRGKAEKPQIVDTRKNDEKLAIADPQKTPPLKTNDLPAPSPGQSQAPDRSQVNVRGYVVKGGKVNVLLSDGRTITERDGLTRVSRNSVEIEGQTLWLAEAKDRPSAPSHSQQSIAAKMPGENDNSLPPPPAPPESSWETGSDGVSRLKHAETLATSLSR